MASCFLFSREGSSDDDGIGENDYDTDETTTSSSSSSSGCFVFGFGARGSAKVKKSPQQAEMETDEWERDHSISSRPYGTALVDPNFDAPEVAGAGPAVQAAATAWLQSGAGGHGYPPSGHRSKGGEQGGPQSWEHDKRVRSHTQPFAHTFKTHLLAEFQFGDGKEGPLGLSFKRDGDNDGGFRVGAVRAGCTARHVQRVGTRLPNETSESIDSRGVGSSAAQGKSKEPARIGSLRLAVGDRIVAVNGVPVDGKGMDQAALGALIRRARRPVRLTVEPSALVLREEAGSCGGNSSAVGGGDGAISGKGDAAAVVEESSTDGSWRRVERRRLRKLAAAASATAATAAAAAAAAAAAPAATAEESATDDDWEATDGDESDEEDSMDEWDVQEGGGRQVAT